jgi:hypothetical protein
MRPRNFSARVVLILGVVILSVLFINFTDRAVGTQAGLLTYCASTPDQSDIYISQIFNTGFTPAVSQDSNPIQNEYNEYLKGRFEFKSNSNFPVTCPLFVTMSEAQSRKQDYEMQMRQGNKHIVELEWNYRPEPGAASPAIGAIPQHRMPRVNTQQADHTFCISDVYQNTVYVTGPVATPPPVAMNLWANGFTDFLKGKYSFQGRVYCNMGTAESGQRLVDAHLDGSRAAGRRVVETSWKYDATQAMSPSTPAQQDEDREPAPRPPAQPPNLQARDFAIKENPRVTAYCVHDRVMAAAFDCDCLRRQIATYRKDHVSDTLSASPTPLEELFKGKKFDCRSCIQVDWKFKPAVRGVAHLPGTSEAVRDCVTENFRTLLTAKPYPTRSQELLNGAIRSCR